MNSSIKPSKKASINCLSEPIIVPDLWIAERLLKWYAIQGRQHLPWKNPITPYGVWLSEVMLQQTQVATVIPYYLRFLRSFPTVKHLAKATQDEVLEHWAGLGYYARGRNLHACAKQLMMHYQGEFPKTVAEWTQLPGIGLSTAGAIVAQAFNQRAPILDGNVKRVLSRFYCIGEEGTAAQQLAQLWMLADKHTPTKKVGDYTQAIMDLGATLCKRSAPACSQCPLKTKCQAYISQQQLKFPVKRAKKAKPCRQIVMLMIQDAKGQLLMMQRPQKGIWGALWSLPEFSDAKAARAYLKACYSGLRMQEHPPLVHTFTHFELTITPYSVILPAAAKLSLEITQQWIAPAALKKYGLPAPIKQLTQTLIGGRS